MAAGVLRAALPWAVTLARPLLVPRGVLPKGTGTDGRRGDRTDRQSDEIHAEEAVGRGKQP